MVIWREDSTPYVAIAPSATGREASPTPYTTGLGLPLSRALAKAAHGWLGLEDCTWAVHHGHAQLHRLAWRRGLSLRLDGWLIVSVRFVSFCKKKRKHTARPASNVWIPGKDVDTQGPAPVGGAGCKDGGAGGRSPSVRRTSSSSTDIITQYWCVLAAPPTPEDHGLPMGSSPVTSAYHGRRCVFVCVGCCVPMCVCVHVCIWCTELLRFAVLCSLQHHRYRVPRISIQATILARPCLPAPRPLLAPSSLPSLPSTTACSMLCLWTTSLQIVSTVVGGQCS